MSAAQELRDAAERLRTLAEKATPGPWLDFEPQNLPGCHFIVKPANPMGECIATSTAGDRSDANSALIAAMHPGVALALADWLECEVSAEETTPANHGYPSLRLARLINGGAS